MFLSKHLFSPLQIGSRASPSITKIESFTAKPDGKGPEHGRRPTGAVLQLRLVERFGIQPRLVQPLIKHVSERAGSRAHLEAGGGRHQIARNKGDDGVALRVVEHLVIAVDADYDCLAVRGWLHVDRSAVRLQTGDSVAEKVPDHARGERLVGAVA